MVDVHFLVAVLLGVEFYTSVGFFVVVVWFVEVDIRLMSVTFLYSAVYHWGRGGGFSGIYGGAVHLHIATTVGWR
jgi:hypothetical protein